MNIIELVDHLGSLDLARNFINSILPEVEFDEVIIYMKDRVCLEANISFFDAEAISNELVMEVDGERFECFFPLYQAQEMVEEYVNKYNGRLSNLDIAKRMLDYHLNDA
ncbi:hypothetical protein HGH93_04800 [Chitinophaga polysaccharea]|uniref:hypothetical protein n=1 Tax=Chitinophaga polysaccharea TaxID=1293035 RepID=UPI0014552D87|nr:hypothetical protein [Chitinophaga polysaccharea]NLR57402.1 hypothetical protein [Chitinophaga polysaccharea]